MVVIVTGANGQLGQSLQFIATDYPEIDFKFCDSKTLDITNLENVEQIFAQHAPQFCINAAAYTAVDKAEAEPEKAFEINVSGAENVAHACKKYNVTLLHVSTDFVFDGTATKPYSETDLPNPTGVYGQTKLDGERAIQAILQHYYIIRTSWVYSQFGANFMKTMLRLAADRNSLSVVNDQIGTPTFAVDLATCLVTMITRSNQNTKSNLYGIYHFSNEGQCSWYEFAKQIFANHYIKIDLKPISTSAYPTPAVRPKYSVLDKSKLKKAFGISIVDWDVSLKNL